jgi:aryl sulfotransferase
MHSHFVNANDPLDQLLNDTPGRVGPAMPRPPADVRRYVLEWLAGDGHPLWPFWEAIRRWWEIRALPSMLLRHFDDLKADLPGSIRRIAAFRDIAIDEARFPRLVERHGFEWMKANAASAVPLGGALWDGGAATFVHRGVHGRWRDLPTAEDNRRCAAQARKQLGEDCAHRLATGQMQRPVAMARAA